MRTAEDVDPRTRSVAALHDPPTDGRRADRLVELHARLRPKLAARGLPSPAPVALSAVPDVLAHGLRAVFCGINPGRASAAAGAHFANPRNDFWRLLHDAGLTPRQLTPTEQDRLLDYGYGLTNAARRTTRGSSDLRRDDFEGTAERLTRLADDLRPLVIAFVGKAAYEGAFRERPELGLQRRRFRDTLLFVLPSTSPANAAVPYDERLHWFSALRELLEPPPRHAVRALVIDEADRVLLYRFVSPGGHSFWGPPGGGIEPGETWEEAMRRELFEETGLQEAVVGPWIWTRELDFVWHGVVRQVERYFLVRVEAGQLTPEVGVETEEGMHESRWWMLAELESTSVEMWPAPLISLVRSLLREGPPARPIDAGS